MAEAEALHDAFIDELRDTYDAEKQLTKALPKLAKAATNAKLRAAFEAHLQETQEALGETVEWSQCGTCDNCLGLAIRSEAVAEGAA